MDVERAQHRLAQLERDAAAWQQEHTSRLRWITASLTNSKDIALNKYSIVSYVNRLQEEVVQERIRCEKAAIAFELRGRTIEHLKQQLQEGHQNNEKELGDPLEEEVVVAMTPSPPARTHKIDDDGQYDDDAATVVARTPSQPQQVPTLEELAMRLQRALASPSVASPTTR
eukprot:PhM_4_TR6954/c0_g1_i1/m.20254